MANGKNKIIVYRDWKVVLDTLNDDDLGKFWRHFMSYVNDKNPSEKELPPVVLGMWLMIKQTLKRDLKNWEDYIDKQKENGAKGGRPKKPKKTQKTQPFILKPKKGDKDNDKDNDINNYNSYLGFVEEIGKSEQYLNSLYRLHKLRRGSVKPLLDQFCDHLGTLGNPQKTLSSFRSHFNNWLQIQNDKGRLTKYSTKVDPGI